MSAVITDRFGNFLKTDFDPNVAANLLTRVWIKVLGLCLILEPHTYQSKPKPLSLRASNSGVKNIADGTGWMCPRNQGVEGEGKFFFTSGHGSINVIILAAVYLGPKHVTTPII